MSKPINRREALAIGGGLAAATTAPALAHTAVSLSGQFEPMPLPAASMFPQTHYFEVDSVKANARYGVWVTIPKVYDKDPKRAFPAIYMPDANNSAPLSASFSDMSEWDFIDPYLPTIQVAVGYTGKDADLMLAVRARDLLPPGEALPSGIEDVMKATVDLGLLDSAGGALYLHNLKNPAADRFLAFLTEELHPFIAKNYRVQSDKLGLFGHSYGGLFATYASLQKSTIFKNFGASSPGILPERSVIFKLHADAAASGGLSDRNLHMTVGTREITVPGIYQYLVGGGSVEFMRLAGSAPLKGLNFSSHLIVDESHISIWSSSAFSFLRRFYLKPA